MSNHFLSRFLRVAQEITGAERCMAIDTKLKIVETYNMSQDMLDTAEFHELATTTVRKAIEKGDLIITNNAISDPAKAPTTNTNIADLRIVIVIPIPTQGAIYIDQTVGAGIIPKEVIDRLKNLVLRISEKSQFDLAETDMYDLYHQLARITRK